MLLEGFFWAWLAGISPWLHFELVVRGENKFETCRYTTYVLNCQNHLLAFLLDLSKVPCEFTEMILRLGLSDLCVIKLDFDWS